MNTKRKQEDNTNKLRLKQAEAESFWLDKQLSNIMNQLNRKDVSLNDANQK